MTRRLAMEVQSRMVAVTPQAFWNLFHSQAFRGTL